MTLLLTQGALSIPSGSEHQMKTVPAMMLTTADMQFLC